MAEPMTAAGAPRPRAAGAAAAAALVAAGLAALDALEPLLAEETARLRAGRLREALDLREAKGAAAAAYAAVIEAVRDDAVALGRFAPDGLALLRRRHEAFAAALATNLAVLATARSVSEGLLRELAADVARAGAAPGYGAGYGAAPRPAAAPLALSRRY